MDHSSSGRSTGRGRKNWSSRIVNNAKFAPMPSASVSTATAVKPGFFSSWRKAKRRSFITQGLHWSDLRCAPGRQETREQGNREEHERYGGERQRIGGSDAVEQVLNNARERQRRHKPDRHAGHGQLQPLAKHECENVSLVRTKSHADADFAPSLGHGVSQHTIDDARREAQGQCAE